jgi:heme/copper-type cytochrome/quinol oxidase subunit 2
MRRLVVALVIGLAAPRVLTMSDASPHASEPVHEVHIVAKKFAFEPALVQVTAGERVRVVVESADTVHGFQIRDLKIDLQVPNGGGAVTAEFTAPPAGRYEIACSEFCGRGHAQMKAALVSVPSVITGR